MQVTHRLWELERLNISGGGNLSSAMFMHDPLFDGRPVTIDKMLKNLKYLNISNNPGVSSTNHRCTSL